MLEACTKAFCHSGGRASEARVDNRATERELGVSTASFIIQPFEHLLPSRHWDLKIAPAPSRWLLVSMCVKPHTCMEVFMHFCTLQGCLVEKQCGAGSIFPLTQEKAKQKLPPGGAESAS